MRAIVTGATGFVGQELIRQLDRPVVLTRDAQRARQTLGDVEAYDWTPSAGLPPAEAFRGVDTVINLAGDPIASGRWTEAKKQRIRDSRVQGTRHLVEALSQLPAAERPKTLVSASAVGYYGDRGDEVLDDDASPGSDFLADVCREWEAAAQRAAPLGIRVVTPRFGVILGHGGALGKMLLPFKLGLGGRLASGKQWMPWIHVADIVGLLLHAADRSDLSGALNATAPVPVTNAEFTRTLGSVLHRPAVFPVPGFALKLAAGELAEVLVGSQRTLPRKAEASGYRFQYRELRAALEAILKQ
jgi:hypothetical protein